MTPGSSGPMIRELLRSGIQGVSYSLTTLEKVQTINSAYYVTLLNEQKNWLLLAKEKVLFHQDNAPVHTSTASMAKLHELWWELQSLPFYSSDLDLAPCGCNLFPNLKKWLGSKKFASNIDYKETVNDYFEGLD